MTTLYFVRHCRPDFSVAEDSVRPLTEEGKQDIPKINRYLDDKAIDVVVSSPFVRAVDSIKPFADANGKEIIVIDGLRERANGSFVNDYEEYTKKQWEDFTFKKEFGESLAEVQERNLAALAHILTKFEGKNIAVSSHITSLCTIIKHYQPDFGYEQVKEIKDVMPFVVKFQFESNQFQNMEIVML